MAIAFGGISGVGTTSTVTSVTVSGSNTIGIVHVAGDSSDNITAVTWGGVSMTKIAAALVSGDRFISSWWVANPSSGGSIVFTGGSFWRSYSSYYTGAKQTAQVDSSNTGTSSPTLSITIASTVVASNSWFVMLQKDNTGGRTYTASGVLASMRLAVDDGGLAIADSNGAVGTGSQSGTLTTTGANNNHGGVAFSLAEAVSYNPSIARRALLFR